MKIKVSYTQSAALLLASQTGQRVLLQDDHVGLENILLLCRVIHRVESAPTSINTAKILLSTICHTMYTKQSLLKFHCTTCILKF
jgi:hypothetical protein